MELLSSATELRKIPPSDHLFTCVLRVQNYHLWFYKPKQLPKVSIKENKIIAGKNIGLKKTMDISQMESKQCLLNK